MTTTRHISLGFVAAAVVASLAACGGGDDNNDGPQASNLADCHNPSMYTVGSSWTVISEGSGDSDLLYEGVPPGSLNNQLGGTAHTYVLTPPPEWGLPAGTVRLSDFPAGPEITVDPWTLPNKSGTYVRIHDGLLDTVLSVTWYQFSRAFPALAYHGYVPGLTEPITLGQGETYQGPAVPQYGTSAFLHILPDGSRTVANPSLDGGRDLLADKVSVQLTYLGRKTVTVPAGTFATCHTRKVTAGLVTEQWKAAEGPYKGIAVKTTKTRDAKTATWAVKSVSADWK